MREVAEFVVNNGTGVGNSTGVNLLKMCADNVGACLAIVMPSSAVVGAGLTLAAFGIYRCVKNRNRGYVPIQDADLGAGEVGDEGRPLKVASNGSMAPGK